MNETLQHLPGEFLTLHPQVSGWILDAARTTAIALGTFGMAWLLAQRSAVARSWVMRMGFVALAIAAVWQVVPSAYAGFRPSMRFDVVAQAPAESAPPTQPTETSDVLKERPQSVALETAVMPSASSESTAPKTTEPVAESLQFSIVVWLEENLAQVWFAGTLMIAAWLILRHFMGLIWLHKKSRCADAGISRLVRGSATSLGVRRTPECRIVESLSNPLMTGWRRAWIWLPKETLEMPVKHQQAIIAHEIAHFRRNDLPWQTSAALICAFWWWNPCVWLLLKRLKSEAELATDECVVSGNAFATDYAEALVTVAARASSAPQRPVGVPMAGKSPVEQRVKAILADNPFRNRIGWIASLALVTLTLIGCFVASFSAIAQEKPSPLVTETQAPETQQQLAERIIAMLKKRHERMRFLHLKVERTWTQTNHESAVPIVPPVPEKMEFWEDAGTGKYRIEYRPLVSRWIQGAAPFFVGEETEVNDGEYTLRQNETLRRPEQRKNTGRSTMAGDYAQIGTQFEKEAIKLLSLINQSGSFGGVQVNITVKELESQGLADIVQELSDKSGKVVSRATIRLDLTAMGALVSYQRGTTEWKRLRANGSLESSIPQEYEFTTGDKEGKLVSHYRVTESEVLERLPAGITDMPAPKKDKFVAESGVAVQQKSILIKLRDAKAGIPIKDVKVLYQINFSKEAIGTLGSDGNVLIQLPEQEITDLRVSCKSPGYVDHFLTIEKRGDPLQLPESWELKLHKASKISGKITNEAGNPIQGALVEAYIFGSQEKDSAVLREGFKLSGIQAKSDAQGVWVMDGFPDDLKGLSMRVSHADYVDTSDGSYSAYWILAQQPYESLRDGSSRIVLKQGVAVEGKVLDPAGNPVKGCRVTIGEDNFENKSPVAITDKEGSYRIVGLKTGETVMTFEGPAQGPVIHKVTFPLANNKMDDVRLEMPMTLRGRVVKEDGSPIAGLYVHAETWREQRNLKFWTKTDAEGRFEWPAAPKDVVTFNLRSGQNREFLGDYPLVAGSEESEIVMKPALRVKITAVDDATGKPIQKFRVTSGNDRDDRGTPYWKTDEARTATDVYEWQTNYFARRKDRQHRFLVEADGYEPHQTQSFPTKQQTETLQVRLKAK